MLRMSKLTDYGLVLLTHLAQGGAPQRTALELARLSRVPLPTVSKILKELSKCGFVASHRGRRGGYTLARPAERISVAEVVEALEGNQRRIQSQISALAEGLGAVKPGSGSRTARKPPTVPSMSSPEQAAR